MKSLVLAILGFCFAARLWAVTPVPFTEGVSFSFRISGGPGGALMTVIDESPVSPIIQGITAGAITESDVGLAWMRPGKRYVVSMQWSGPTEYWLSFIAPKGYVFLVDDVPTTVIYRNTGGGGSSLNYNVELRPAGNYQPAQFGSFSGIDVGKAVSWDIGLGALKNGRSAGRIVFKESDLTNSPATRGRLYYSSPTSNGEISVVKDGPSAQTLRQVVVPQGLVDIIDDAAGGYWLKFYQPSQIEWSPGNPAILHGSPWKTIRVELPSATVFKVTDTEGAVAQVSQLTFTPGAAATGSGGSVVSSGGYNIHTFTSSGTFVATGNVAAEVLLVGGGGGGGAGVLNIMNGGGGGAGGVLHRFRPVTSNSYAVTVGSGGASNTNGANTSFAFLTAIGGGKGASGYASPGGSGGCGGGEGTAQGAGPGYGLPGQGANGANGYGAPNFEGGGGGGAGGGGAVNGGPGIAKTISGATVYYSGGGGGASNAATGGTGGVGGGGNGGGSSAPNGTNATPNTGGGGGAGNHTGTTGGSGGSGIVIIKYPTNTTGISSGNYTWTLQEGDGTTWERTTTHASTTYSGYRYDMVQVRTGGVAGTVVATSRYRYEDLGWGEELTEVSADPATADLKTVYTYYPAVGTPITNLGHFRQIRSVTTPDGNWTAYQYWDDWNRRGQVQREFHPFADTPATVSFNQTLGRVIYYDYTPDWTGRYTRPVVRQETTSNTLSGNKTWSHGDSSAFGWPTETASVSSYWNASSYQTDYTETYRGDAGGDQAYRPYVSKGANQTQTSFSDANGNLDLGTGAFTVGAGSYLREIRVNGSTNSSGATPVSSWGGQSFANIYLLPNRSTVDATIQDARGNVVRTESWVYAGGTFVLLSYSNFTCDQAGRVTAQTANNGILVSNTYTNGRLTSSIDSAGTETSFTYDLIGRVRTSSKVSSGTTVTYTYDGANNVKQTKIEGGTLAVITTGQFDLAGRQFQRVENSGSANQLTTGWQYTLGGRIVTTTLPGGATKIEERYTDGQFKSLSGTAVVGQVAGLGVDASGKKLQQVITAGVASAWVNNYWDWLGRQSDVWKPGGDGTNVVTYWTYNSSGQLAKFSQPGLADTLYEYDTLGRLKAEGLDLNANGSLDRTGTDRIKETVYSIQPYDSGTTWWEQVNSYTYATNSSGASTQTGILFRRLNNPAGTLSDMWENDIFGNPTHTVSSVNRATKTVTNSKTTSSFSNVANEVVVNGFKTSSTDASGIIITYGYDALGRPSTVNHPRTGATTTTYIAGTNLIDAVKDPANVAQATYTYNSAGLVATVKNGLAAAKYARYEYNSRNQKLREWGDTIYPVSYDYDASGRKTQMVTYATSTAVFTGATWPTTNNPQTTTWDYFPATGLLKSKTDAGNNAVNYTYTAAGQLYQETSARLIVTTNTYSPTTGELTGVAYTNDPAATPGLSYTYDRLGNLYQATDATGQRTFNYNLAGTLELQTEVLPAGFYGDMAIRRGYDSASGKVGRYVSLSAGPLLAPTYAIGYGYEATTGRLNASWGFNYTYETNSNLVKTITNPWGTYNDTRAYNSQHDWVASRVTTMSGGTKASFVYTPDQIGRISEVVKTGEIFSRYADVTSGSGLRTQIGYNDRSELANESTFRGTTSTNLFPGRDEGYVFDLLGNRKTTTHNGTSYTWTSNSLNQSKSVSGSGRFDVAGAALASSTVTVVDPVTGTFPTLRFGQYFFEDHALANSGASIWRTLTVNAPGSTPATSTVTAFALMSGYTKTYDADGNLTNDGRWTFTYDAKNRLVSMETRAALCPSVIPNASARRLEFKYDYMGRRVEKIVRGGYTGSSYPTVLSDAKFVYDGWNELYELNALSSNAFVRCNVWGLDLSGSMQGAGGVGGLLATYEFAVGTWAFPAYDSMGNIHGLLSTADGSVKAAYEYDGFGKTIRDSGEWATTNPFRFSTKFADIETGLVYYGHRYYSPSLGRFICRDPKEESGHTNLYAFLHNNAINHYDYLGWESEGGGGGSFFGWGGGDFVGSMTGNDGGGDIYVPSISYDKAQFLYGRDNVSITGGGSIFIDTNTGGLVATQSSVGAVYNYTALGVVALGEHSLLSPADKRNPVNVDPKTHIVTIDGKPLPVVTAGDLPALKNIDVRSTAPDPGENATLKSLATDQLDQLRRSGTMASLYINAIEDSSLKVTVNGTRNVPGGYNGLTTPGDYERPSGSWIDYDPTRGGSWFEGKGTTLRAYQSNGLSILGHELTHAYQFIMEPGRPTLEHEFEAGRVENEIRDLQGVPTQNWVRFGRNIYTDTQFEKYVGGKRY